MVADYIHWNAGWGPVRPGPLSGACGAALVSRGTSYREFSEIKRAGCAIVLSLASALTSPEQHVRRV